MNEKRLGKITKATFGHGGYQDCMLGLHLSFASKSGSWGVSTTKSEWDSELIPCSEHAKWTETDRSEHYDEIMRFVAKLLSQAKVSSVDKLQDIPVEVTFENNTIVEWRILEEVI